MAIELISKIKPKNNGKFFLVDAIDVEYNNKPLPDAITNGDFGNIAGANGTKWYVSTEALSEGGNAPEDAVTNDLILDKNGTVFQVNKIKKLVSTGVNIKGQTGLQGEPGPTGPQGTQGIQGIQGPAGSKGEKGDAFSIAKTFRSVEEMNAGFATDGVKEGQFVIIDTGNVEDEDNAKLYVKGKTTYTYITDLSGAAGITGPEGPQGVAGPQGIQGPQGVAGITPQFEIRQGHLYVIYPE